RREAVTAHDLGELRAIRRPVRRLHHRSDFLEVQRTDRRRRDDTQRFGVLVAVVVEAVHGAARDAQGLSGSDIERLAVDGPRDHALEPVDRLCVVVVAVRGGHQTLRARYRELEDRDAAARVLSGDEKAYDEWAEANGLVGWIDAKTAGDRGHGSSLLLVSSA